MKKKIKLSSGIYLINKKFKKKEFYHYIECSDVSIIVPCKKNKFLVVSQKRIPINKTTFEFPSGWVDKGEKPFESAAREMFEETGYKTIKKPIKLASFYAEPGRLNEKRFVYYTKNFKKIQTPEKGIKVHLITKKQLINLIRKEKFCNSSHISSFFIYLNSR